MLIGIDFGTTKSVVAVIHAGRPTVIPDERNRRSMPSVVMVAPDQSLHVGWDAVTHPQRYEGTHFSINSIKRLLGKAGEATWGNFRTYPQEVSALILAVLRIQAESYLLGEIAGAVIAVPAHFDINQRWATMQAAEIAGLRTVRLVNEATAAMLAWAEGTRRREDAVGLVFDFGGGTLDVSIVECGTGVYEVKTTAGDDRLGGDDFDQVIIDHCLRLVKDRMVSALETSLTQQLLLRESARRAKEELSSASSTEIYLPGFIRDGNRYHDLHVPLERDQLERLCAPLLARTKATIQRALDDVKGTLLDNVVLVGGTSRMPSIQRLVRQVTGLIPVTSADPEFCVAQGACLYAGTLYGVVKDMVLLDVVPGAYGVAVTEGRVAPMIPRNTTIPTKVSKIFTTTADNQSELTIRVVQGEGERVNQTSVLGEVHLSGLPPARAGVPEIEVTFDIDANNGISVIASDKATGREVAATLQAPYRLNFAQIKVLRDKVVQETGRIGARLAEARESDLDRSAKEAAAAAIREVESFIGHPNCPLGGSQASLLSAGIALLQDHLRMNVAREELEKLSSSLLLALDKEVLHCIEGALKAIAEAPEFVQWVAHVRGVWHTPARVKDSLASLEDSFRDRAEACRSILRFAREEGGGERLEKHLLVLRTSSGVLFCLAALLDSSVDPRFETRGPIEVHGDHQSLLTTVILRELLTTSSRTRRQAAARALLPAWKGTKCFFLLRYVIEETDPDIAASMTRCLDAVPQGGWAEFMLGQELGARQELIHNAIVWNLVRQDILNLLRSGQASEGEAALRVIEALRLGGHLPELPELLDAHLPDAVKVSLIKLLVASPHQGLLVPLFKGLAATSPEVRYAALMGLERLREWMGRDYDRLFRIAYGLMARRESLTLQDRLFLWRISRHRKELQKVARALRAGWREV